MCEHPVGSAARLSSPTMLLQAYNRNENCINTHSLVLRQSLCKMPPQGRSTVRTPLRCSSCFRSADEQMTLRVTLMPAPDMAMATASC